MQAATITQRAAPDAPIDLHLRSGRSATIAVQIYRHLRRQIVDGDYVPRQPLSENELAQRFGVSRTPVREALGKLEEERLVSILPQYGTFVAPILTDRLISDQFVREALECAAIGEAAARCTPRDADALRAIIAEQRAAPSEKAFFAADEAMHRFLMALAGQEAAWQVVDAAKVNLDRIRLLAVRHTFKRQSILGEHESIADAVVARNPDGAIAAMRQHLRGVFASSAQMMRLHPEFFQAIGDPRPVRSKRPTPPALAAASRIDEPS